MAYKIIPFFCFRMKVHLCNVTNYKLWRVSIVFAGLGPFLTPLPYQHTKTEKSGKKSHKRIGYLANRNAKSWSVIESKGRKYLLNIVYSGLFRWSLFRISMCVCACMCLFGRSTSHRQAHGSNAVHKIQTLLNRIYLANWDILLNKLIDTTATKTTSTKLTGFSVKQPERKTCSSGYSSKMNQSKQITTTTRPTSSTEAV